MKWIRLSEIEDQSLRRGAILRFPAKYPYEDVVDFMVFDPVATGRGLGLIVDSGQKAGLILVLLPEESCFKNRHGLSTRWLRENWEKWVYPETKMKHVYVCSHGRSTPRYPKENSS